MEDGAKTAEVRDGSIAESTPIPTQEVETRKVEETGPGGSGDAMTELTTPKTAKNIFSIADRILQRTYTNSFGNYSILRASGKFADPAHDAIDVVDGHCITSDLMLTAGSCREEPNIGLTHADRVLLRRFPSEKRRQSGTDGGELGDGSLANNPEGSRRD